MSNKKVGDFFVQEPGIGGAPADWDGVMITPPGHPMLRNDLGESAEESVEFFRKTMAALQESMGVPIGGYPKGQMAVVVVGNTPKYIPTLTEMDRLLLLEPEPKMNWSYVTERLKERPSIVSKHITSVLENPNGRHALLMTGRTMGKTQTTRAWLEFEQWELDMRALKKSRIRAALRAKTKKGPKRKTYPL